jgi:predicted  nucleic acid-binding Zn-ribbon protein
MEATSHAKTTKLAQCNLKHRCELTESKRQAKSSRRPESEAPKVCLFALPACLAQLVPGCKPNEHKPEIIDLCVSDDDEGSKSKEPSSTQVKMESVPLNLTRKELHRALQELGDKHRTTLETNAKNTSNMKQHVSSIESQLRFQTEEMRRAKNREAAYLRRILDLKKQLTDLDSQLTVSSKQITVVQEGLDASLEVEKTLQEQLLVQSLELVKQVDGLQHELAGAHSNTEIVTARMREQRGSLSCIACTTERKTVVFFCGHTTYCHACYKRLKSMPGTLTCPLCRVPIKNKIVYFAP